jgi:hypothetical protein
VFVDDDALGIATIGGSYKVLVWAVESENPVRAKLLKASLAFRACAIRIDKATDRWYPAACRTS